MNSDLTIEPDGSAIISNCPDCGGHTVNVWGYVSKQMKAHAAYFIRWTEGHVERGAQIVVSVGNWGAGTTPDKRRCVGMECRMTESGPTFMVVDAAKTPWGNEAFLGRKLARVEVLAHPIAKDVFEIMDRVIEDDPRVRRFLGGEPAPN